MSEISEAITADNSKAQKVIINNLSTITKNILNDYIKENSIGGLAKLKLSDVDRVVDNGLKQEKKYKNFGGYGKRICNFTKEFQSNV